LRPGRGIEQPSERIDEIGGDDGIAVRPFRVAQLESPGQPIGGRGPARGDAGNQGPVGVVGQQTLEQVVDYVGLDDRPGQLRIERRRLALGAATIDRLGSCRRSADGSRAETDRNGQRDPFVQLRNDRRLQNALRREGANGGISSREADLAIQSAIGAASSHFLRRASVTGSSDARGRWFCSRAPSQTMSARGYQPKRKWASLNKDRRKSP